MGRTYLASLEANADDHARLFELLDEIEAVATRGEPRMRAKLSDRFHEPIYRGCKNLALQGMLADYDTHIKWFKALNLDRVERSPGSRTEHRRIVDHSAKKDLLGLTDAIQRHIFRQRDEVTANFLESAARRRADQRTNLSPS